MRWAPDDGWVELGTLWWDRLTGHPVEVVGFRRHITRIISVTVKRDDGAVMVMPYHVFVAEYDRAPTGEAG